MTREEAIQVLQAALTAPFIYGEYEDAISMAIEALSAEAVHRWRTGKPTESGEYMATLDAWGHKYIDIMHYSKPMLPSRKVKGMCWYKADNEWGDVVYEDEDILAWMPLPKPYREKGEHDESNPGAGSNKL